MESTPKSNMLAVPTTNIMVSPAESVTYDNFHSPALNPQRYTTSPVTGRIESNKMSPPASGPPKNMASLLSPPMSPYQLQNQSQETSGTALADPALYSAPSSPALATQRPLFTDPEQFADLIAQAVQKQPSPQEAKLKPTVQEYSVFVSAAFELYHRDPQKWLDREKKYVARAPTQWNAINKIHKSSTSLPSVRTLAPARKSQMVAPTRVSNPLKLQRSPRTPKATPKLLGSYEAFSRDARIINSASGSPPVRIRQPATREDTDFDALPDFCPPLSTLNENSKFRVEWKGNPLDLSNDPHRHLLHPAELQLASILRLSCASYLTSKRRIFKEKVERTRQRMEFRKTDSQKACKIDVNKASKLWQAYEKIGWFDAKFITPHL